MIVVEQRDSRNNTDGLTVELDTNRSISVFDNVGTQWIVIKNGERRRNVVLTDEAARALYALLAEKFAEEAREE